MAERRETVHYAWLRNLLLIASGTLALLVSLHTGSTGKMDTGALRSLHIAWGSLGLGILLLAVALHGEVWSAHERVRRVAGEIKHNPDAPRPVVWQKPLRYRIAAPAGYLSLCVAVVALVCHGMLR